jgi:hypothetical protein
MAIMHVTNFRQNKLIIIKKTSDKQSVESFELININRKIKT